MMTTKGTQVRQVHVAPLQVEFMKLALPKDHGLTNRVLRIWHTNLTCINIKLMPESTPDAQLHDTCICNYTSIHSG